MSMLSKEFIASRLDRKVERVDVPEWGGYLFVRSLSARELDEFEASLQVKGKDGKRTPDLANVRAKLALAVCCDDQGLPLFGPDDLGMLANKSASALTRIAEAANKLNGQHDQAVEDARGN